MAAAPSTQPQSKVSTPAIEKAVNALLKWKSSTQSSKPQLLPSDEFLYLVLTVNKIPPKSRTNAFKVPLPHPLYSPDTSELCLFVHDSLSKPFKEKVASSDGCPISKVIKLSKLKKEYKAYEQKRKLCDSFDMFFADKRIVPLLPNAIGKQFYRKKKIPVPVELGRGNWKEQIERVCSSALVYLSTGTCSVIRVAKASMSKDEICDNVLKAIEGVVDIVPKKWLNVRAFHLKFSESLALPVYQKVPELGLKISPSQGQNVVVEKNEIKKVKKEREKVVTTKKGRIHEVRYMDSVEPGLAGMVRGDDSGSEVDEEEEVENIEVPVKKRKKGEKVKKSVKKGKETAKKKLKKSKV